MNILFKRTPKAKALGLYLKKGYSDDAGFDLPVCWRWGPDDAKSGHGEFDKLTRVIRPGEIVDIPCGISIVMQHGYWAEIKARGSSFIIKRLHVHDAVMDSGFTGEWMVAVKNMGDESIYICDGDSISQALFHKVVDIIVQEVDHLPITKRGSGQLGSTD